MHEILRDVQPFQIKQKSHQHIFCKKNGLNSLGHCSSHFISSNDKITFAIVGPKGDPMADLANFLPI